MNDSPPTGLRGAGIVLGAIFALSTLLAFYMFSQYSRTLSYVRQTIGEPDLDVAPTAPLPWAEAELTPEECVDATLLWAERCTGIKTMCDMYVERYIGLCLEAGNRDDFCASIRTFTGTSEFGVPECRARGVQRNVNKEACAMAYKTIDGYCEVVRRRLARDAGAAEGSR